MMITTNLLIKTLTCLYLLMTLMTSQTLSFQSMWYYAKAHQDITHDAILQTTADVCRSLGHQYGRDFVLPDPLTVESVAAACSCSDSAKAFQSSISEINNHNAAVDFWHLFSAQYHFENEEFLSGRDLITEGVFAVKFCVKQQNYQAAREALGKVLHVLQDFYSHSNWIELGKTEPYSNLIKPDTPINNIADSDTCTRCYGGFCTGEMLEEIIANQKLTSGYFPWSKPIGKCSLKYFTWSQGGCYSSHLHIMAASAATTASSELLQDIRAAVGDLEFLRLMGLSQASVLCFVIDTTGSMSKDIAEIRRITSSIIDNKTGTAVQPSEYILVPFNDFDYGPLTRTTDPNVFKQQLDALTAVGGGDSLKMSLSGLQLALTGSPPQTDIFVFTDADAKDKWLTSTVRALIEKTKSVVTFILTNGTSSRRSRRSAQLLLPLYQDLATASGGQVIQVTKGTLAQTTNLIADTSISTLVTLFQAVRDPGKAENFSVFVDHAVQNLTIYITGNSPDYTITSPSGVSQSSTEMNGTLVVIQRVGNLHTVKPSISDQAGQWFLNINSAEPYSIRVVGQSMVDFTFDFLNMQTYSSYTILNSGPAANTRGTLLVSVVSADIVQLEAIFLVGANDAFFLKKRPSNVASGQYLVTFNSVPAGEFSVMVAGQIRSSTYWDNFQRHSPTQIHASCLTITTQPVGTMEPGTLFTLPYTITTSCSGGSFNIHVSNDRNFVTLFKTSITVASSGSADGIVTLFAPENTPSGTDVTVTIQAEAPDGSEFSYAVQRLAVVAPVTDLTPPLFEAVNKNADCSGNCSLSSWYLTANVTDGKGSGIENVRVLQGNGNLNTTTVLTGTGVKVTMIIYNSSCCYPEAELVAVDAVGNVATYFTSIGATAPSTSTAPPAIPPSTSTSPAVTATKTTIITTSTTETSIAPPTKQTSNTTSMAHSTTKTGNTTSMAHSTTKTGNTTSMAHSTTKTGNTTSMAHSTTKTSSSGVECHVFLSFLWLNVGVSLYQFI